MKKIVYLLALLALTLLPLQSVYALDIQGPKDGRVVIGQDFTLKSGDTLDGDLVVIGGQATIEQNAVVNGDIVIIGGSLNLNGKGSGDAVVIGGLATMGQNASLVGNVVTVGGSLQRAEGAMIGGNIVSNLPPPDLQFPNVPNTQKPPLPPAPKFEVNFGPLGTAAGIFFKALGLAALAMLLTVFLHPQLDRVAQAVVTQPFMAGSIGFLTVIVAPIAVIILTVTLILIPVALAGTFLLGLAFLFGAVAFGMEVGDRFTKAIHQTWEPVLSAGFGTFLLAIVLGTVNLVPCIGWLAGVLVGLVGLGAAVITLFGTRPVYHPALVTSTPNSGTDAGASIPPAA
jgi:hypothetical protein